MSHTFFKFFAVVIPHPTAFKNRNYSVCKVMGDKHAEFSPVKFSRDGLVIDAYYRETWLTRIF